MQFSLALTVLLSWAIVGTRLAHETASGAPLVEMDVQWFHRKGPRARRISDGYCPWGGGK